MIQETLSDADKAGMTSKLFAIALFLTGCAAYGAEPINLKTDAGCKAFLKLLVWKAKKEGKVNAINEVYGSGIIDLEEKAPSAACDDVKYGIAGMGSALAGHTAMLPEGAKRLRRAGEAYKIDVSAVAPKL